MVSSASSSRVDKTGTTGRVIIARVPRRAQHAVHRFMVPLQFNQHDNDHSGRDDGGSSMPIGGSGVSEMMPGPKGPALRVAMTKRRRSTLPSVLPRPSL